MPRPRSQSTTHGQRPSPARTPDPDQENHYQLLNVAYTATSAEITRSYREAIKRVHPDRVQAEHRMAAEDLTKDLNEAYRVLTNPVQRVAYDRTIRQQEIQDQVMQRYVGGFAGAASGGVDPYARNLKREPTLREKRDQQRSERSALVSLLSIFLVITLGVIGLILLAGLVSFLFHQFF